MSKESSEETWIETGISTLSLPTKSCGYDFYVLTKSINVTYKSVVVLTNGEIWQLAPNCSFVVRLIRLVTLSLCYPLQTQLVRNLVNQKETQFAQSWKDFLIRNVPNPDERVMDAIAVRFLKIHFPFPLDEIEDIRKQFEASHTNAWLKSLGLWSRDNSVHGEEAYKQPPQYRATLQKHQKPFCQRTQTRTPWRAKLLVQADEKPQ